MPIRKEREEAKPNVLAGQFVLLNITIASQLRISRDSESDGELAS